MGAEGRKFRRVLRYVRRFVFVPHLLRALGLRQFFAVRANHLRIEVCRILRRADLRFIIDMNYPEARSIPLCPFEVIEQRPILIPEDEDPLSNGAGNVREILTEKSSANRKGQTASSQDLSPYRQHRSENRIQQPSAFL